MLMGQGKQPFSSFANEPNGGEREASEEGGREKGRMRRREEGKIPQSAGQREGTRDNVHQEKDG